MRFRSHVFSKTKKHDQPPNIKCRKLDLYGEVMGMRKLSECFLGLRKASERLHRESFLWGEENIHMYTVSQKCQLFSKIHIGM